MKQPQLTFILVHLPGDQIRVDAGPPAPGCPSFTGVCYVIDASSINPLLYFPKPLGLNAVEAIAQKVRAERGQ